MIEEEGFNEEIERKWIINPTFAEQLISESSESFDIEQGYFGDQARCRINRGAVDNAVISIKINVTSLTRMEFNYPIPIKDAEAILTQIDTLSKRRYNLGNGFTIDKFFGRLEGFYLIEKEYESEELAQDDVIPAEWLENNACDVTDDTYYTNAKLLQLTWDVHMGLYKEDGITPTYVNDIDIEALTVTGDVEDVMPDAIIIP